MVTENRFWIISFVILWTTAVYAGVVELPAANCNSELEQNHSAAGAEVVPFDLQATVKKNLSLYLDPAKFINFDWRMGTPMLYPKVGSITRRSQVPSQFGRDAMLDRSGYAVMPLWVFEPGEKSFRERWYPVLSLSPETGNPILIVQPNSHLFVPTISKLQGQDPYAASSVNMTAETLEAPVKVKIYDGRDHQKLFTQLVVVSGHKKIIAAKRKRQPIYIELMGNTDYYHATVSWEDLEATAR